MLGLLECWRDWSSDKSQPSYKMKVANKEEHRCAKEKFENRGGSQIGKPNGLLVGIGTMVNSYWVPGCVLDVL